MTRKKQIQINDFIVIVGYWNNTQKFLVKMMCTAIILQQKKGNQYYINSSIMYPLINYEILKTCNNFEVETKNETKNINSVFNLFQEIIISNDEYINFIPTNKFISLTSPLTKEYRILKNIIIDNILHEPTIYFLEYLNENYKSLPKKIEFNLDSIKDIIKIPRTTYGKYPQALKKYVLDKITSESKKIKLQIKFELTKTFKDYLLICNIQKIN